uniref:Uncharacterized protein n=1 Tax=Anguilla anguilla TaxID=7936 RepID=A0A0E9WGG7_ANGAN
MADYFPLVFSVGVGFIVLYFIVVCVLLSPFTPPVGHYHHAGFKHASDHCGPGT